jgi:hypothetical protein
MRPLLPLLLSLLLATACGGEEPSPTLDGFDTSEAGIAAFLKERRYQGWLAEPAVHASPIHGRVRVFFNDTAVQSLRAGNATHPPSTLLVKELYSSDDARLTGHALEVKVEAGAGKDTWLFYEAGLNDSPAPYYGRGHPTCHGCHEAGKDYVTSALPE